MWRTIKFRAYHKKYKKIFKVLQLYLDCNSAVLQTSHHEDYHFDDLVLMQYTWFKDIDWIEVYEWDIVDKKWRDWIYKVIQFEKMHWNHAVWFVNWFEVPDKYRIIWNIYDNPIFLTHKWCQKKSYG